MEESTAPATPASEATPTTNLVPEAAPAEAPQAMQAPVAPTADIPADQIEAFNKFVNANGGFEKAFAKLRNDVSTPAQPQQQLAQQQIQVQAQEAEPQVQAQQYSPMRPPEGFITQEEWNAKNYFDGLSNEPAYAGIADKIRTGEVLGEMAKFGIKPMVNGFFNDRQIRDFLNLYSKTVPTQAPSAPVTNTPTVEYVNVGEQITSRDDAIAIINQNRTLKAGVATHPQTEAAKEYLKKYFNGEIKK